MLKQEQLQDMSDKLYVYDVEQGAWEQEPNGFEANAKHVLTYLTKDLILKNFSDREVLQQQIAPDLLQYALRLGRWANQGITELLPDSQTYTRIIQIRNLNHNYATMHTGHVSTLAAVGTMAANLHDHDHTSLREKAIIAQPEMARQAARFLVNAATRQAVNYSFDIDQAFDDRLTCLRERFGIPQPSL